MPGEQNRRRDDVVVDMLRDQHKEVVGRLGKVETKVDAVAVEQAEQKGAQKMQARVAGGSAGMVGPVGLGIWLYVKNKLSGTS